MEVKIQEERGVVVLSLIGNLDSGSAPDAQEKVLEKIKQGTKFVLDMKQCPYVSSAGLRTLLVVAKRAKVGNASGVMAALADEIKEVMEMTGFDGMFVCFQTLEEAVNSLQ